VHEATVKRKTNSLIGFLENNPFVKFLFQDHSFRNLKKKKKEKEKVVILLLFTVLF